jgi:DNA-binding GntR family transcriptional regulator
MLEEDKLYPKSKTGANSTLANETGRRAARDGEGVVLVHDRIRSAILSGALPPGKAMGQTTLANELGVSRAPVREALRMLQSEGLLHAEPNRRVRIAEFSAADGEAVYALRIGIEAIAIQTTVPTLQTEDFARAEGLMTEMDYFAKVGDIERQRVPHRAFHMLFVAGAGSRFESMAATLFDHAERYRIAWGAIHTNLAVAQARRREEHQSIVDAAASGDGQRAAEQLAIHYARTATAVIARLEPERDLSLLRTAIQSVAPGALTAAFADEPKQR